jgi:hypothetical protein
MRFRFTMLCAGACVAVSASSASAALLVYEPFDYTPVGAPIVGQTNASTGGNWNTAGGPNATASNLHQIAAGNLTSPIAGSPNPGGSGLLQNADNTQLARLDLPATYYTDTTLYYSVLLNISDLTGLTTAHTNANANNDIIIGFNNTQGATGGTTGSSSGRPSTWGGELVIRLGSAPGTYNLATRASAGTSATPNGVTQWTGDITADSATHLIVVRYAQGSDASISTDDSNDLWVDPAPLAYGAAEGSVPGPDTSTIGSINPGSPTVNYAASLIIGAGIASGATPSQMLIDDVRVGETWADVTTVPEPAGVALLGLSALVAAGRQRRRQRA